MQTSNVIRFPNIKKPSKVSRFDKEFENLQSWWELHEGFGFTLFYNNHGEIKQFISDNDGGDMGYYREPKFNEYMRGACGISEPEWCYNFLHPKQDQWQLIGDLEIMTEDECVNDEPEEYIAHRRNRSWALAHCKAHKIRSTTDE